VRNSALRGRSALSQHSALDQGASPPPPFQRRKRASEGSICAWQGSMCRPVVVGSCHDSAIRPAFQSALLCAACLRGCSDVRSVFTLVRAYQQRAQPPLGSVRRTSDAPLKARLQAPGVSGNHAFRPKYLRSGSHVSGWPAVASVQAPPHVRSRTASLIADCNMPAWRRAGQWGYPCGSPFLLFPIASNQSKCIINTKLLNIPGAVEL